MPPVDSDGITPQELAEAYCDSDAPARSPLDEWANQSPQHRRAADIVKKAWPRYRGAWPGHLTDKLAALDVNASVLLWGPTGSGKTHQAWSWWMRWAWGQEWFIGPPSPQFWAAPDMMDAIRRSFDGDDFEVGDGLLVIDDLATERVTDWVDEQLYRIVNDRYRNVQPLFVTTNLKPSQLVQRFGDRLVSRLIEMCAVVEHDDVDRRLGAVS